MLKSSKRNENVRHQRHTNFALLPDPACSHLVPLNLLVCSLESFLSHMTASEMRTTILSTNQKLPHQSFWLAQPCPSSQYMVQISIIVLYHGIIYICQSLLKMWCSELFWSRDLSWQRLTHMENFPQSFQVDKMKIKVYGYINQINYKAIELRNQYRKQM